MARIDLIDINLTLRSRFRPLEKTTTRIIKGFFGRSSEESEPIPDSFSLTDVSLTVPDGKTMVILGPSGCGKTTLLKVIAGLLPPASGQVRYNGEDLTQLPPQDRGIGMVFQSYALYPNFSAKQNILSYFLFRKRDLDLDEEVQEKFKRTSDLMGVEINHLLGRMPPTLSGGERQRVALARCITRDPALFLMDEPFSNLDAKLREKYRLNLKKLLHHFKITTIYVTHDQHEAIILADLISIMDHGRIVQTGTYEEIYQSPKSQFVAEFLNLEYETRSINLCDGAVISPAYRGKTAGFRPEDASLTDSEKAPIRGRISDVTPLPLKGKSVVTVETRGNDFQLYVKQPCEVGDEVGIFLRQMHLFDAKTGARAASPKFEE